MYSVLAFPSLYQGRAACGGTIRMYVLWGFCCRKLRQCARRSELTLRQSLRSQKVYATRKGETQKPSATTTGEEETKVWKFALQLEEWKKKAFEEVRDNLSHDTLITVSSGFIEHSSSLLPAPPPSLITLLLKQRAEGRGQRAEGWVVWLVWFRGMNVWEKEKGIHKVLGAGQG